MHRQKLPTLKPLALAIALSATSSALQAQDSPLIEVLVTAQKRSENLQDVPISVAAVSGSKLDEVGVENIEDLTKLVPNIHLTQTGLSTQMRIRGIGSDNSQGFEQSVGTYKNGIYHGRAQLLRAPIFDMERVEVMRGPQSTLFGKNSIAGAIDLITARPTDDFTGKLDTSYETQFGTREITGIISGPLTDALKGRLALRGYDDPGYFYNTFNHQHTNQQQTTGRLSLDWQPLPELTVHYTGEKSRSDSAGRNIEIVRDDPNAKGLNFATTFKLLTQNNTLEGKADYKRQADAPEYSDNNVQSHSLIANYDLSSMTLTSTTGLVKYDYQENCDCDFSSVNLFQLNLHEDYKQISQELRLTSAPGQTFDWLAGVFFQNYQQEFGDRFSVNDKSGLFPVAKAGNRPLPAAFGNTGIFRSFDQESDTWAAFAQVAWHFTDASQLILGGRYTAESKDSHKLINMANIDGVAITDPVRLATAAYVYKTVFKLDTQQTPYAPIVDKDGKRINHSGHDLHGSRDENAFTPSIKFQHDFNDDLMAYASYAKGFKAGGFDPRSNSNEHYEFEDEQANAYELGLKSTLADGALEVNSAFFRTDYENLQISQFDGGVGFNVGNAKDTQVQGVELDGRWAMTQHIMATYGISYLDFEYQDFKNGNCNKPQIDAGLGVDTNADGKVDLCDYTGKRGVYTPKYTLNTGLTYKRELANATFTTGLDLQYVSNQQVHVNLDPQGEIDAYTLVGLRIALEDERFSVALSGENLTDEYVSSYMANVPLSDSNIGSQTFYSFARRPRTYTLSMGLKF
ncbi:MAG TPA: TonB-dependent receptor [Cellvibrionaceae bacterium]|nr:TonB-dependent receptor [Cellvibrionaceae bacterium]